MTEMDKVAMIEAALKVVDRDWSENVLSRGLRPWCGRSTLEVARRLFELPALPMPALPIYGRPGTVWVRDRRCCGSDPHGV